MLDQMNENCVVDEAEIWHPCSQMADYEALPPLHVASARGPYLHLKDGRKIIDVISSWWTKPLGHSHPKIKEALCAQLDRFEHVMLANTTHDAVLSLTQRLADLAAPLNKVFFASDGCCAVEIAIKMSLHARMLSGQPGKTQLMALENSYHGETLGALAVSDCRLYRKPYEAMLAPCHFMQHVPYVLNKQDPLWQDCASVWPACQRQLDAVGGALTAIIIEPILQGAGGMKIMSADFVRRLAAWAKANDVHLICDEILSGLCRTGRYLAYQHAGIVPDFVCLSKALTGGFLPMSVTLTSQAMYDLFYGEPLAKSFLHSNTFAGNALAAACADTCLSILMEEAFDQKAANLQPVLREHLEQVASKTGVLENVRGIGAFVAADLTGPMAERDRAGWAVYRQAIKQGLLLRPLGNTLYWMPPLNVSALMVSTIAEKTVQAIQGVS